MNDDEVRAFLERPLTAVVSTTNASGAPHSVPVWYRFDGSTFAVWTGASRLWVKNAIARPDVGLVVAEHEAPFSAVIVRGTAEVSTDGPATNDEVRRITARYIEASGVEDYVAQWARLRTIVRITPRLMRAWGQGY